MILMNNQIIMLKENINMSLGYRKLNRDSANRKALLRDLVTDLIINGVLRPPS